MAKRPGRDFRNAFLYVYKTQIGVFRTRVEASTGLHDNRTTLPGQIGYTIT